MSVKPKENGDRLPPSDQKAERAVLGSMLRDNLVIGDVVQVLGPHDFYHDAHRTICAVMLEIYDSGKPVDLVILADRLMAKKQIENVGGYAYLGDLWDCQPHAGHAEYYAKIVREKSILRQLSHSGNEIARDAFESIAPAEELLSQAEAKILSISELGQAGETVSLQHAMQESFDRLDDMETGNIGGVPTGYLDLDELTCGFRDGELTLIAARPSSGKTAFALCVARNIALHWEKPVLFVSLEQSRVELAERLLCCQARVNSHHVRTGRLDAAERLRMIEASGELRKPKFFIDDTPGQTVLRIGANCRRLKARHAIACVFIDYLQLIEPDNPRENRQEQVSVISRRLKHLARELEIPVVALSQVNRTSEDRSNHQPRLADLRESGSLEQNADTVFMLHRPELYEEEKQQRPGQVDVLVRKNRNGRTGEVTLTFLKEFMRFENFAEMSAYS